MPRVRGGRYPATSTGRAYPNVGGVRGGRFPATNTGVRFPPVAGAVSIAMVLIESQTLGAAAASITFSSIPATYDHLQLVFMGRRDTAATGGSVYVRLNSDTASNYDYQLLVGQGAATTATSESLAVAQIVFGGVTGNSAAAGIASGFNVVIFDYARTAWQKSGVSQVAYKAGTSTTNLIVRATAGFWRSTAAVTSITLLPNADNFLANTIATLYGIKGS